MRPQDRGGASLSVAVLGQFDSGKSTIVGHLRYLCGCVSQREMDRLTQQAADSDRAWFNFAWVSDKRAIERERCMTISGSHSHLRAQRHELWLADTPGNPTYIQHSVRGAATTDHAVLVVAASDLSYEIGMAENGPTRELALIAFAMGAQQLVVAVNKMDPLPTPYAQARFDQITTGVGAYLSRLGFKDADVQFVPVAGYAGENLVTKSSRMPWYEGATLLDALDNLTPPVRSVDKPFRMPVQGAYHVRGVGIVVTGYIQTGVLRPSMQLDFGRSGLPKATVFSTESHHEMVAEALPGMGVGISIKGLKLGVITRGDVASNASHDAVKAASSFTAQLVFVKDPSTYCLTTGYTPMVRCQAAHVACRIREITAKLDRATGEILARPASADEPFVVLAGDACLAVLESTKHFAVEAFREYPSRARVVVRDTGGLVAVGIVKSVTKTGAEVDPVGRQP